MTIGKIQHNIGQIKMTDYILNTYLQHNQASDPSEQNAQILKDKLQAEYPSIKINIEQPTSHFIKGDSEVKEVSTPKEPNSPQASLFKRKQPNKEGGPPKRQKTEEEETNHSPSPR